MALKDERSDFVITPLPPVASVGAGSVDLRVGRIFLSTMRSSVASVDVDNPMASQQMFDEVRISQDRPFVIQSRQFVLASTFEYISLPLTMCGFIQSRSTFGRMGLVAATSTFVGPGYKGCPTLELVNTGEIAISLKPNTPVCQLILMTANEDDSVRPSRYQCLTRPNYALGDSH